MCDDRVYLAPQNIPRAIVLTFGNQVILYCITLYKKRPTTTTITTTTTERVLERLSHLVWIQRAS